MSFEASHTVKMICPYDQTICEFDAAKQEGWCATCGRIYAHRDPQGWQEIRQGLSEEQKALSLVAAKDRAASAHRVSDAAAQAVALAASRVTDLAGAVDAAKNKARQAADLAFGASRGESAADAITAAQAAAEAESQVARAEQNFSQAQTVFQNAQIHAAQTAAAAQQADDIVTALS